MQQYLKDIKGNGSIWQLDILFRFFIFFNLAVKRWGYFKRKEKEKFWFTAFYENSFI